MKRVYCIDCGKQLFNCNSRANVNRNYWQEIYTKLIGEKNLFPTKNNDEDSDSIQKEISSPSLFKRS
jgi:Fe-S cluster biosynthesis and repair protein YggX